MPLKKKKKAKAKTSKRGRRKTRNIDEIELDKIPEVSLDSSNRLRDLFEKIQSMMAMRGYQITKIGKKNKDYCLREN